MQNTELLSFNPDTLQHPGSCSDDVQDQAHVRGGGEGRGGGGGGGGAQADVWGRIILPSPHPPCVLLRLILFLPLPSPSPPAASSPPYPPQLLALYLASLARLLRFQGHPLALEADYCTCMAVMILEGWKGLPLFGGNMHFWQGAMDILQAKAASKIGSTITHERLDLAQVGKRGGGEEDRGRG